MAVPTIPDRHASGLAPSCLAGSPMSLRCPQEEEGGACFMTDLKIEREALGVRRGVKNHGKYRSEDHSVILARHPL
ncbi:protein of unknown function [Aminobacter niigataensis]|nr:protein of unknown function [Aminobacter niigataensis]